jgi:translocation and assembly module TamB
LHRDLHEVPPRHPRHHALWKRVLAWSAGVVLSLILLAVIAVIVLLHTASFHRYVLRTVDAKASTALAAPVHLNDFRLSLSNLSLDLYGITVEGAGAHPTPPLLSAEHIGLRIGIRSIIKRKWYLKYVTIDHPVLHAIVDKTGANNFPHTQSKSGQSHTSIFDLGIRHALLDRGEIYYNNRKSALNADLHDLSLQSVYDTSAQRYSGTLSYRNGHLQMANYNPIPHDLDASFALTPTAFTLNRAVLTSGHSRFVLSANARNFSQPILDAKYNAVLDATEFRRVLKNSTLPIGILNLAGSLHYVSLPGKPPLNSVMLNGNLSSRALTVHSGKLSTTISNLAAGYVIANGNADVPELRAGILGGELSGNATIHNLSGAARAHVHAALQHVSLAELKAMAPTASAKQAPLTGTADLSLDATSGKTMNTLVASVVADIRGAITSPRAQAIPVNGNLNARYVAASQTLSLAPSSIRTPQTSIDLDGTISNRSALAIHVQSNDLHELESITDALRTPVPGQPSQPIGLYGKALFTGTVSGSTAAPRIAGVLNATNLRVRGSTWKLLRTNINLNPSLAQLSNGQLQPAGKGNINFNLSAGLHHWSFTPQSPLSVNLNASQLDVANLARAAGSTMPIAGTLNGSASVHGSELSPYGQGKVTLTSARVENEPIHSIALNFSGTRSQVLADLALRMPAGQTNATLNYLPRTRGYQFELHSPGIRIEQLQTIRDRNLPLAGTLLINATGAGTLSNPQLKASIQIPQLKLSNQAMNGVSLVANVANHVANVALDSRALNTSLRGRAQINLSGNYEATASLDTQPIPLQPLIAIYSPAQAPNFTGQTELHATLRGPLKQKPLLEAHVNIPTLELKYKNAFQIGAAAPIRADYVNSVLTLQHSEIRGTDTDLQFQGRVPINSSEPASLLALGNINLAVVQIFAPTVESSGEVRFNVNSFGARTNPNVQGQINIVNANFASGTVPLGLQDGNGTLTLTKDRLEITKFQGMVGGGTLTASGGVAYKPALRFDVGVVGKNMRMVYPDGVREEFSTNLALSGTTQRSLLSGRVAIEQLSFTPSFDLNDFMGQFGGSVSTPPAPGSMTDNVQLNVAVQSTTGINLVSKQLSLEGTANLQVRGTAAQPVILGRINLNGGDLIFMNNHYELQGTIDFVNPSQTQPVVNVTVNTTVQQYNIHLHFQGPSDHLITNYTSDPALPPADIINLLVKGETTEQAQANPTAGVGAESIVASGVASQVTNRIQKIAGISSLSVDPTLGANTTGQQNLGARITIQQRVTSNLFVTFATDVTSTQSQQIQVQYKFTPRVSFSGTRDQNGGFGFETRIRKSW